jgi:hypothetical protein
VRSPVLRAPNGAFQLRELPVDQLADIHLVGIEDLLFLLLVDLACPFPDGLERDAREPICGRLGTDENDDRLRQVL